MNPEIWIPYGSATGVAFAPTLLGPDHYLPFVAITLTGTTDDR